MSRPPNELESLRELITLHKRRDRWFVFIGFFATSIGLLTLIGLFGDLITDGYPRLGWDFFSSFPSRRAESAGILSAMVGTLMVMIVTAASAIPLGIAAGIYLEEYASRNRFTDFIEINVSNLAGVPSIVYGLLALGFFVQMLDLGRSVLSAGLTLGLLTLPVIIVATREAIRTIPGTIREAAYALGASKWQVVSNHVVPYSMGGILTGVILGLSRAIGETAPVITIGALTFIAFLPPSPIGTEAPFVNFEWLFSPFTVLPIQMFNWLSRPQAAFLVNAAATGIIIVTATLLMNGLAIWLRYRYRQRIKW
jgi:phosphate transport system permease protein